MTPGVWIPTLLPLLVALAIRRAERRIHQLLSDARAFSAEAAVPLPPGRWIDRRRLQSLIREGAVRETASHRCFLDAGGWERHQSARRRRALFALTLIVPLVGIALAILSWMR